MASSGMQGSPVIKGIMAVTAISSLLAIKNGVSQAYLSHLPRPLAAAARLFSFTQPTELAVGLFMMYHFRIMERNLGSSKFSSFAYITSVTSWLLTRLASRLLGGLSPSSPSSSSSFTSGIGPYWFLFSLLAQFAATIPSSSWFDLLGLKLGDKTFTFISALTLLISAPHKSFIAGVAGFMSGLLYRANFLNMRRFRLPSFIVRFFSITVGRLLHDPPLSSSDPRSSSRWRGRGGSNGGSPRSPRRRDAGQGRADGSDNNIEGGGGRVRVEPTPDAIERLVEMGFDAARAERALRNSDDDVDSALQMLLDGH